MKPFVVVRDPDCPKGRAFLLDPAATTTLAKHPKIAQELAAGKEVFVTTPQDQRTAEEVRDAIRTLTQRLRLTHPSPAKPKTEPKRSSRQTLRVP